MSVPAIINAYIHNPSANTQFKSDIKKFVSTSVDPITIKDYCDIYQNIRKQCEQEAREDEIVFQLANIIGTYYFILGDFPKSLDYFVESQTLYDRAVQKNILKPGLVKAASVHLDSAIVFVSFYCNTNLDSAIPKLTTMAARAFKNDTTYPLAIAASILSSIMMSVQQSCNPHQKIKHLIDASEKIALLKKSNYSSLHLCATFVKDFLLSRITQLEADIGSRRNLLELNRKKIVPVDSIITAQQAIQQAIQPAIQQVGPVEPIIILSPTRSSLLKRRRTDSDNTNNDNKESSFKSQKLDSIQEEGNDVMKLKDLCNQQLTILKKMEATQATIELYSELEEKHKKLETEHLRALDKIQSLEAENKACKDLLRPFKSNIELWNQIQL